MSSIAPPPAAGAPPSGEFGPSPNATGGNAPQLPAPATAPSPGAMQDNRDIMNIIHSSKSLAMAHPQLVPMSKAIIDQAQKMIMAMTQAQPPQETAAPPV
jgi:hypothetical protein